MASSARLFGVVTMLRVVVLLPFVLLAIPVLAAERLIAVLPLDVTQCGTKIDAAARTTLEEEIRTVTGNALSADGYTVLTGENTLRILQENGIGAEKACEASCALEAAQEIKAELFIAGSVAWTEGEFVAYVRLYESKRGSQVASLRLEGAKVRDLRNQFAKDAPPLWRSKLLAQQRPPVPAPPPPVVRPEPAYVPPVIAPPPPVVVPPAPVASGPRVLRLQSIGVDAYLAGETLAPEIGARAAEYCEQIAMDGRSWRLPRMAELHAAREELRGLVKPFGWDDEMWVAETTRRAAFPYESRGYLGSQVSESRWEEGEYVKGTLCLSGEPEIEPDLPSDFVRTVSMVRLGVGPSTGMMGVGFETMSFQEFMRFHLGTGTNALTAGVTFDHYHHGTSYSSAYATLFLSVSLPGPLALAMKAPDLEPDPNGSPIGLGAVVGYDLFLTDWLDVRAGVGAAYGARTHSTLDPFIAELSFGYAF